MTNLVSTPCPPPDLPGHTDWPKLLEWIEKQAQDSLKARYATAELISKEAQTTLTVLLAGVGGSAAYASKLLDPGAASPIAISFAAVCFYLVGLCVYLVTKCMMFESYPALYQDPKNLLQPQYTLDELREAEVTNIGDRIDEASEINLRRAKRLNGVRLAAAVSPLVFVLAAVFTPKLPMPAQEKATLNCRMEPATSASAPASSIRCEIAK